MTLSEYADVLLSIYHKLDIRGNTKEPITTMEMVVLFGFANHMKEYADGKNSQ